MNKIKIDLIKEAKEKHGEIYPCHTKDSLDECFTIEVFKDKEEIIFWFNDKDNSTFIIRKQLN